MLHRSPRSDNGKNIPSGFNNNEIHGQLFIRWGRISFKRLKETLKLLKPHVEIKSI